MSRQSRPSFFRKQRRMSLELRRTHPEFRIRSRREAAMGEASRPTVQRAEEHVRIVQDLTIAEARELLDWLEGHAVESTRLELDQNGHVTIRWES
jgi:hypothetical protein